MNSKDPQITEYLQRKEVKAILEALLFASSEPIAFCRLRAISDKYAEMRPAALLSLIRELQVEYDAQGRAFQLEEVGKGFILKTRDAYSSFVAELFREKRTEKLTQSAKEVLAIIAYRQPITKPQIEAIRGVDSSGTIQSLLERELIESVGKLEAPGRPTLYGVTDRFLHHFGLKSIEELKEKKHD